MSSPIDYTVIRTVWYRLGGTALWIPYTAMLLFAKKLFLCSICSEQIFLVAKAADNSYPDGIRKSVLEKSRYLFCNFALQEVGSFIWALFPPYYSFQFEVDICYRITVD